jgi:hypothetical protein
LPILLSLRPTDDKTPIPGAVTPPAIDAAALQGLETEIRSVFAESDLITPAQVQGRHASLREAVQSEGWPLLGATRGKIMILLDGKKAGAYRGKLMFAVGAPDGAVLMVNDARRDRGRIAAALRQDLLVMTRADDDTHEARRGDSSRREAAFASGAQVVLTDFIRPDPAIGPYHVTLAELHQARCGAMLGTEKCVRLLEAQTVTASLP